MTRVGVFVVTVFLLCWCRGGGGFTLSRGRQLTSTDVMHGLLGLREMLVRVVVVGRSFSVPSSLLHPSQHVLLGVHVPCCGCGLSFVIPNARSHSGMAVLATPFLTGQYSTYASIFAYTNLRFCSF
jgi:hypothetical protein